MPQFIKVSPSTGREWDGFTDYVPSKMIINVSKIISIGENRCLDDNEILLTNDDIDYSNATIVYLSGSNEIGKETICLEVRETIDEIALLLEEDNIVECPRITEVDDYMVAEDD